MTCNDNDLPTKNGIEKCEDLCKCGTNLRLHTHIFGAKERNPKARFYVDCPRCGITSDWHDTVDEAIEDFDKRMNAPESASEESDEDAAVSEVTTN